MVPKVARIVGVVLGVLTFGFETDVLVRHIIRRKKDFDEPTNHINSVVRGQPQKPPPRVVIVDQPSSQEHGKRRDHDLENLMPVAALMTVNFRRHDAPMFVLTNEDHEPERHHPEFPNGNPLIVDHPHASLSIRSWRHWLQRRLPKRRLPVSCQ